MQQLCHCCVSGSGGSILATRPAHARPRAYRSRCSMRFAADDNTPTETPAETPTLVQDLIRWANDHLDQEERDADDAMPPDQASR